MRAFLTLLLLLLALPAAHALTGYCTGKYIEKGEHWQEGLVQEGDIFEYWCELPEWAPAQTTVEFQISTPSTTVLESLYLPRELYGTSVGVYP